MSLRSNAWHYSLSLFLSLSLSLENIFNLHFTFECVLRSRDRVYIRLGVFFIPKKLNKSQSSVSAMCYKWTPRRSHIL